MTFRIGSTRFGNRWTIPSPRRRRHSLALERLDDRVLPSLALPQGLDPGSAGSASPAYVRFSPATRTTTPTGYAPAQVRHAYGTDQLGLGGAGQTIAIVDAYDDPNITGDLQAFDRQFNLPDPPNFRVVAQDGSNNLPGTDPAGPGTKNWEGETALDVEWAHAMAPGASILLVETNNSGSLDTGVAFAKDQPGVSVVSMSWGSGEYNGETSRDGTYTTPAGHQGVTFVAASGDFGTIEYPAASPKVLAVGGTVLSANGAGSYLGETGWTGSGGGISSFESQPAYQKGVVTQSSIRRTDPDVAYNAGAGVAVYDSYNNGTTAPWASVGGTSAGAPQWSALIALADQGRALRGLRPLDGPSQTLPLLYHLPAVAFHDITSGSNQAGGAAAGYDLVTGRGSPIADQVVTRLIQPFAVTNAGPTLYQLDESGSLWKYSSAGWASIAINTQSFAVEPVGTLWALGSDGLLRLWTGTAFQVNRRDVQTMVIDGLGRLDVLTTAGTIWRYLEGAGWQEIDAAGDVRTMVVDATGRLDVLTTANTIWRYLEGAGRQAIDAVGNVQMMVVDGTGRLDVLTTANDVWRYLEGAGWQQIDPVHDVRALVVDGTGRLDVLTMANTIWRYVGSSWQEIDAVGDVQKMAVDGLGRINVLTTADTIWRYLGASWQEIDAVGDVRALAVDGFGQVNVLRSTRKTASISTDTDGKKVRLPSAICVQKNCRIAFSSQGPFQSLESQGSNSLRWTGGRNQGGRPLKDIFT
jgi:hypothetical protein